MPEWRDSTAGATGGWTRRGDEARRSSRGDEDHGAAPRAERRSSGDDEDLDSGGPDPQAPAISAGDSDAGLSTIREAPRAGGSTTQGRAPGLSAAMARAGSRARRSVAPRTLAVVLGAMFVGTCASVYVVSRMAEETGEPGAARGGAGSAGGASRAPVEGASLGGPDGGSGAAGVATGAGSVAGPGAVSASGGVGSGGVVGTGSGGGVEWRGASGAGGAAGTGSGGVEWRGATAASGAAGAGSGGGVEWRGAEVDGSGAPVTGEAAQPASGGESLWVPVAQADGEAAERRRKIAAQARALMSEPRLLACLLGHVTIGVGRRTALTGSLVVAGDGEVVRASVRGGDRAVPAGARACVAAELEKSRFVPGPQAQLVVPLRLEIH
ncbi:hypothetical protein [Nannocystis pusilla]|uniref:hypothetical protein n=1 Tax=Nannocystis pusilla TaxID=889268 RepID=UPI003BF388C0